MSELALAPDSPQLADAARHWKSAYVHIPFCARRCPYCDFAIVDESVSEPDHRRYIDAVVAEIAMEPGIGRLDAVDFGGGTPSRLAPAMLGRVIDALADRHGFADDVEVSLEVNPEDWDRAFGAALVEAGCTRISIGAQSLDGELLGVLGRLHRPTDVERVVGEAHDVGFASVSIDVILGHPAEDTTAWSRTLEGVAELDIDHLSTYALTVEPGTRLAAEIRSGAPGPDDDIQAARYDELTALATSMGLVRYEVSNMARPGHACRYNLATWAHGEYLGFGMAAHDHVRGVRSRNHRRLDRYLEAVEAGHRPRLGSERLNSDEGERDRLMLGLRLAAGTPLTAAAERFLASDAGRRLLDAGTIVVGDGRVRVGDLLLADAVAREALSVSMPDC